MKTRELVYTLTHITHCTTQVEDRRDHVVKGIKLKNETHIMCQLEIEVSKKGGEKEAISGHSVVFFNLSCGG